MAVLERYPRNKEADLLSLSTNLGTFRLT